ncbi:MAG: GNAT family N-acetyltransferase [Spirochaetales bacterium]|jgi:GNAT superfamily N-acetyltransferase|nr:GNAT family N-acetyltransferase [Spirochaetales bacterium]
MDFHTVKSPGDLDRISKFLAMHYQPGNRDCNWFYPIWEHSYTHPYTKPEDLDLVGIWEDDDDIVAAALIETMRHDIGVCTHPEHRHLRSAMLEYAETTLYGTNDTGGKFLNVFVHEFDEDLNAIAASRGYTRNKKNDRPMSAFQIPGGMAQRQLPEGFRYVSLADEVNLEKMNRALHRGFNHQGEPDNDDIAGRKVMVSGPNFKPHLTTAIEAPDGNWVSYCGMWHDEDNHFGYVEPVATDPDYRRQGLGTAAVLESIRKCGADGADTAYVWTDLPFYLSFGFKVEHTHLCWTKYL